jgi:SAM-dependent methyltransferase
MTTLANGKARARQWWLPILLFAVPLAGWAQQATPAPEKSVKPGINDDWKKPDIQPLIERLETESREIYHERENLAGLVGPKPGAVVADIGAGSGFMTQLFAKLVGPNGKVFAEDINPKLLEHISQDAAQEGLKNVQTVLGKETSVELPANSVDLVFLCDAYHHFEYPRSMLASIYNALRPGGQIVLVEFQRIPGQSPAWMLEHTRAGKEVFSREITDAGFELINDHKVVFLKENYVLRFRKGEARR